MRTLLVGDVSEYLSQHARSISKNAELITQSNFNKIAESTSGIFYTSLGDFTSVEKFTQTLLAADQVIYYPPKKWIDNNLKLETQEHLYQLSWIKKIRIENLNFDFKKPNFDKQILFHSRASNDPQIWSFGCSVTAGNGILSNQIYSEVLAKKIGLDITRIAYEGSSISWAVDQILMSDIQKNDIVVLGVTSLYRLSYILHSGRFYHVVPRFYEHYPLMHKIVDVDDLVSPNNLYQSYSKLAMVQNFCHKLHVHLVMLEVIPNSLDNTILTKYPGIIHAPKTYIDKGSDYLHPGPKQHSWFSDQIYQRIIDNKWLDEI